MIAEVDGPDPDDNLHMPAAAAAAGKVETTVTWNAKDFDCGFTGKQAITIVNPDEYLCALYEKFLNELLATVTRLAAGKRRPPMTAVDVVSTLERAGASPRSPRGCDHVSRERLCCRTTRPRADRRLGAPEASLEAFRQRQQLRS